MRYILFLFLILYTSPLFAQSIEEHQRLLQTYRSQQRWIKASEELKIILDKSSEVERQNRSEEAAEAFFKARDYREAAKYYQLLSEKPENQNNAKIFDKLTSSYARSSQFDLALKNLSILQSLSASNTVVLDFRKIFILYDANRCSEAIQEIDVFLNNNPKSTRADDALWFKMLCKKNLGNFTEALEVLNIYKSKYPESKARVLFWETRLNKLLHHTKIANSLHRELLQMQNSFYSQWESRIKNLDSNACLVVKSPFAKTNEAAKHNKKNKTILSETHNPLSDEELRQILKEQEGLIQNLKPNSFNSWIDSIAKIRKFPPALVYAIMYEESRFNPKAISPADALGLMQMIPETGNEIAEALSLANFDFNDLLEPWLNAKFGITYLSMLLDRFSGNLIYTIAAYNAGPEAVERWIHLRQEQSCEEWMDQIPFKETHNYVQKVLKSMWRFENEKPSVLPSLTQPSKI